MNRQITNFPTTYREHLSLNRQAPVLVKNGQGGRSGFDTEATFTSGGISPPCTQIFLNFFKVKLLK